MDNPVTDEQQHEQQQPQEEQQKTPQQEEKPDTRSFDELSPEEQQDMIRTSFFGEDSGEDTDDDKNSEETDQPKPKPEEFETPEENKETEAAGDQKEAEKKEKESAAGEETESDHANMYSTEEFLTLSPDAVNPDRLPKAARLVHNQYVKWFNQTVAPRLNALQQFYNNAQAQKPQTQQAQQQTPPADNFNTVAKAEAARRLGVKELDEFNPDHAIMLQRVVTEMQYQQDMQKYQQEMQEQMQKQQQAQTQQFCTNIVNEMKAQYKDDFAVIDAYAEKELRKLPVENFMQVMGDLRSGDAQRVKNVYKMFADRYYSQKKAAAAPQQKPVQAPPKVIGGSSDTGSSAPAWGVSDFAKASPQKKTEMLAEKFFSNYK